MGEQDVSRSVIKRLADIISVCLFFLLFGWLILILALLVRLRLGSPILFKQQRPGLYGKPFEMMKFRTMTSESDENGNLLPDEKRMTPFGSFLRKASLDELPELWNVLKGDMSLVGPRPLLMKYLELYSEEQMKRHNARPGITGWAQVNGRNSLDWESRFKLDLEYIKNWTPLLDLKILWQTLATVLKRSGVSAEGHVTMPEFTGTKQIEK